MSLIAVVGGGGTSIESYFQLLRQNYQVLDATDVVRLNDLRVYKFLVFPERLALYAPRTYAAVVSDISFHSRLQEFLADAGRVLVMPPAEFYGDFSMVDSLRVEEMLDSDGAVHTVWMGTPAPIFRLDKKLQHPKLLFTDDPLVRDFSSVAVESYTRLDCTGTPSAHALAISKKGTPYLARMTYGSGEALFCSISLTFLGYGSAGASQFSAELVRRIVDWGLCVPTRSMFFAPIVGVIRAKYGPEIARFLEKADSATRERRLADACDYAFKSFERILMLHAPNAKTLNDAIQHVFPQKNSRGAPLAHSIRASRNKSAHGHLLPDELTLDETEYLLSGVRFILKSLALGIAI